MLEQVLAQLNNWFDRGRYFGTFQIQGGSITLPFLASGQYYRIVGSTFNDGLHRYGDPDLQNDETFDGAVWALAIPVAVVSLADDVSAWQEKNGDKAASPLQSESFGGYSYSKKADTENGGSVTWETVFRSRLNAWRKI